jgi:hypothetical protein
MVQAIFGLVGVLVGAGVGFVAQYLRPSARSVRGAARLLDQELEATSSFIAGVLSLDAWQGGGGDALPNDLWLDRRALLAAELGPRDWYTLRAAYESVDSLRALSATAMVGPLPAAVREQLALASGRVAGGRASLQALSGKRPQLVQMWRRRY